MLTDLNEIVTELTLDWSPKRILAAMGMLDKLCYHALGNAGLVVETFPKDGDGEPTGQKVLQFDKWLCKAIQGTKFQVRMAITGLGDFLGEHWDLSVGRTTLGLTRDELASWGLGLFQVGPKTFSKKKVVDPATGKSDAKCDPTLFFDIDIAVCLQVYQQLRIILEEINQIRRDQGLPVKHVMPKHSGSYMVRLYEYFTKLVSRLGKRRLGTEEPDPAEMPLDQREAYFEAQMAERREKAVNDRVVAEQIYDEYAAMPQDNFVIEGMRWASEMIEKAIRKVGWCDRADVGVDSG